MSVARLEDPREPAYLSCLGTVDIRHLECGDRATILEVFEGMAPRSRELRFLTAKPRLTSADLRQLTAVDRHHHVAMRAVSVPHGCAIGVARFVRDSEHPETAEVAVAVVDDWQGRGVGTMLVDALIRRARELGVRRFTMAMAVDNDAALGLMHGYGGEVERTELHEGVAEYAVTLDAGFAMRLRPGGARARAAQGQGLRSLSSAPSGA